ncbi:MAG TPA: hypothetical protein VIY86_03170 [Pirellulaceae bacterium]
MSFSRNVTAFSHLVRTILGTVVVAAVGYGGGWVYTHYVPHARLQEAQRNLEQTKKELSQAQQQMAAQDQRILELGQAVEERNQRISHLSTSIRLLKVDQRVAELVVLKQERNPESGEIVTDFRFQELTKEARLVGEPRMFRIEGDVVYLDYWVVKFQDEYVEQAELDRSASICLFRRLFGEFQEPQDGFTLDEVGVRPSVYGREEKMSDFERQIWTDFWSIALDPNRAAVLGVRAAHGEAVSVKLRPGKRYRVTLRASDGLSVGPPEDIFQPAPTA